MHQIENEYLKVQARDYGAELISIVNKKDGIEHLWHADPKYWNWHAPVLFPVIGRCLNDRLSIDGKYYPMQKHGFARKSSFQLLERSEAKLVFVLREDETTLASYPYRFEFLIAYHLAGYRLTCSYEVRNMDDRAIYFSLGGHPAFAVPFVGGQYKDYFIEFEQSERLVRHYINSEGFFDGRTQTLAENARILPLKEGMFKEDALIFKNLRSRKVSLKTLNSPRGITVGFEGFNYLGLWAKTSAPYICIEPWIGCADTLGNESKISDREDVICLDIKQNIVRSIHIEVI